MRLIIFHYHLNPGGVTRIVESQIKSLKNLSPELEIVVLTGDCPEVEKLTSLGANVKVYPILNYLSEDLTGYENKLTQIKDIFNNLIQPEDTVHAHNLNLGKNPLVTLVISQLASKGLKVVNHSHDFAEDRPANNSFLKKTLSNLTDLQLKDILYPNIENYLFATLNTFDKNRLISYGLNINRINLLPNPVVFSKQTVSNKIEARKRICSSLEADPNKKLITYPVRVIRRKNIAEFVLLAVLFKNEANWIVTQPPKNPLEIDHYDKWKKFCSEHHINIFWEAGTKVDFEELIVSSDFCISTSIQEGFGMVYMEPWLLDTPVIGRNIQMVTEDITATGIQFPLLYNKLEIPVTSGLKEIHELEIDYQMQLVKNCLDDNNLIDQILKQNPFLNNLLSEPDINSIKKNKEIILSEYSLEKYGEKLNGIYKRFA